MDANSTFKNANQSAQETASPFAVGQLLDGKYEVLSFLGKGGMGSVYCVKHVLLGVELALKTLDTAKIGDANSSRRFQNEGRAAFSLKHPNLVKVHDFGVLENEHPYLAMDLVKGKTLQSFIKERGRLSLDDIESIFVQLCFGLAHAHSHSVVHRDVKPANIMLVDGMALKDEGSVKILDFGIAKIANEDRGEMEALTATGEIFGSPLYMSPEQCAGGAIDQRSDVYSLGCVLFEALTGTPPLVGANPLRTMMLHASDQSPSLREAALGIEFPETLEHTVAKMLAKNPSDRYADLGLVAHEISKACSGKKYSIQSPVNQSDTDSAIKETATRVFQSASIKLTPAQLKLLLASTAILSVLGTLSFVQLKKAQENGPKSGASHQGEIDAKPKQLPDAASIRPVGAEVDFDKELTDEMERSTAQMKSSFEHAAPIKAQTVIDHGSKYLSINFPDSPIGVINYTVAGFTKNLLAKGIVKIPIPERLYLQISAEKYHGILSNAFIYDRVDPDLFNGLILHGSRTTIESQMLEHGSTWLRNDRLGAAHILDVASKWTRLHYLDLDDFRVSKEMIKSIDSMQKLTSIKIVHIDCDLPYLAQQHLFARLQDFEIQSGKIDELIEAVSNSQSIQVLTIGKDAVFSPAAIRSLSKNHNLLKIDFAAENITDDVVKAACDLPQISQITVWKKNFFASPSAEILKKWKPAYGPDCQTEPGFISLERRH